MGVVKKGISKKFFYGVIIFVFLVIIVLVYLWRREVKVSPIIADTNDVSLVDVKKYFNDYVQIEDGGGLYKFVDNTYQREATVHGKIEVPMNSSYEIVNEYFKVLNNDYYVKYDEVSKIDGLSSKNGEYKYYQNYVVYNESVVLKNGARLYVDDINYYEVNGGIYAIVVKDANRYGIEYNHGLVYVERSDVSEIIEKSNTDLGHTDGVSVLNYHYVVSAINENGELDECRQSICITDEMFDNHIRYLKENGYYGVSMRDLELFIDGKIQLPEKSVVLTFDDGWYVARTIGILEKYQILGTLFLIGSLASPNDYVSDYLEVHSHTWNLHKLGDCPSSVGRGGILCLDENTILEDLKRSRESLNNTTYFCYPFYDYNDRAIQLLQQVGFTMAFVGELRNSIVRVGQDKFKIPRYVIINSTTMEQFISYVS